MRWWRALKFGLRESFWVIPTFAVALGVALGGALVELDALVQAPLDQRWPRLFGAGAEGARGTLAAIAGSMITVAGVVFSVTIVALSLAADAYSPRVLRTFMHDRPTQASFGVFVGIFAYCLVVLRTVRADDGGGAAFVPSLAVFGALVLALVGVWVLVYFIHHVSVAIQVSTILERVSAETRRAIDALFPDELGQDEDEPPPAPESDRGWHAVPALRSGYVVEVDSGGLLEFARKRGAVLRMERAVGEFVIESQPLASLADGATSDPRADARALDALYTLASERTIRQDAAFGVQQIVDIATRALSPGINDPSTATMCIDHLSALCVRLARRRMPSRLRGDPGGPRVIARGPSFAALVALGFEPLTRHAANNPDVLAALERAALALERAAPPRRRGLVRGCLDAIASRRTKLL